MQNEVETVRCIMQRPGGKILLLQKSDTSKAASLFEFPGGKIEEINDTCSTIAEQTKAVHQEVFEETGINLSSRPLKKVHEFTYSFEHKGATYSSRVHMFYVRLLTNEADVSINTTVNAQGESEDKHQRHLWLTADDILALGKEGKLSGNTPPFTLSMLSDYT